MKQKNLFKFIFIFLSGFLIILPFLMTFNDVITKFVENFRLYVFLREKIVPFEVVIVSNILSVLRIKHILYENGIQIEAVFLKFTWNCLGWQSLLIYLLTLLFGLRGQYTIISKFKTIMLGFFGVFWINIFRITFTIILAKFSMPVFRLVFHDVLASMVTIFFLFFFWWFSYSYVLEEKGTDSAT